MSSPFRIEALAPGHDRASFVCGRETLDKYLRERATQDIRRRVSACYVALDEQTGAIAGYYTLAAGSVALSDLSEELVAKLPRYPLVPVARIGRLAVSLAFQKRQLGAALLWDAGLRALRSGIGIFALVVDAKDETAAGFYRHHGFVGLTRQPLTFVLPVATLSAST